ARWRERFLPPSGDDGEAIGRPMRRENEKENVVGVIHIPSSGPQRSGKRGGRGVASLFAVEFDDGWVGAKTARNDLRGAGRLALKHPLISEQSERNDADLVRVVGCVHTFPKGHEC